MASTSTLEKEINLNNVTNKIESLSSDGSQIIGASKPLTFTNTTNMSSASYQQNFSIYAHTTNVAGTNGSKGSKTSVTLVYDPKSAAALVNSKTLNILSDSERYGYRLYSSTTAGKEAVGGTVTENNKSANYVTNYCGNGQYDNSKSLTEVGNHQYDLMFYDGLYTTNPAAYINYTTTYYSQTLTNTVNYSTVNKNDYRYATFAWRITSSTTPINFITINLKNSSTLTGNGTSWYTGATAHKLYLYYRVEDTANATMNWSKISSPWIDGNSFDSNTITDSNNFCGYTSGNSYPPTTQNINLPTPFNTTQTSKTLSGLTSAPSGTSTSNTTFTVKLPNPIVNTFNTSANPIYLYVRIGVHMADLFSFGNPTASISTQAIGAGFPSNAITFDTNTSGVAAMGTFGLTTYFNVTATPFYADTNDLATRNLTFNFSYTPVSNSVRYVYGKSSDLGRVFDTTPRTLNILKTTTTDDTSYPISFNNTTTPVYPDTKYTISGISVTNTRGLSILTTEKLTSDTAATSGFDINDSNIGRAYITQNGALPVYYYSISTAFEAKKASNAITYTLILSQAALVATIGPINVQNSYTNRGRLSERLSDSSPTLVTLSSNFSNGGINGNAVSTEIKGFGSTPSGSSTGDSTIIDAPTITNLGANQYSGYYQTVTAPVRNFNSNSIFKNGQLVVTPTESPYTVTLTATYPSTNNGKSSSDSSGGNPVVLTYTSSSYYYDGDFLTAPTSSIGSFSISTTSTYYKTICGINVYNDSKIYFDSSVTAGKIGTYFYNKDKVVLYNIKYATSTSPSTPLTPTTSLTPNVSKEQSPNPNGVVNGKINENNTFTQSGNYVTQTIPSTYTVLGMNLTATVYNPKDDSTASESSTRYIIYDPKSITGLITTIPTISTTPLSGCRVWSGLSVGQELTLPPTLATLTSGSTVSISSEIYNQTKNIINDDNYKKEALFVNNSYTNSSTYAINYNDYTNNSSLNYSTLNSSGLSVNYGSGLTNYRYTTFAWKVDTSALTSTGYLGIKFVLNGISTTTTPTVDPIKGSFKIGTSGVALPLFYRIEKSISIIGFTELPLPISTPWINGNLYSNDNISNTNYNQYDNTNFSGLLSAAEGVVYDDINKTATFNVIFGNALNNKAKDVYVYIYCRVAIPVNIPFSFTDIKCNCN